MHVRGSSGLGSRSILSTATSAAQTPPFPPPRSPSLALLCLWYPRLLTEPWPLLWLHSALLSPLCPQLSQSDMLQVEPALLQYPDWRGHLL